MNEELRERIKKGLIIGGFFGLALLFFWLGWSTLLTVYIMIVGALSALAILLQSGRGGGLAASLGGLGGDSLLGVRSATPIAKATYVLLALFVFQAILLSRIGIRAEEAGGAGELLQQQQQQQQTLPGEPAPRPEPAPEDAETETPAAEE